MQKVFGSSRWTKSAGCGLALVLGSLCGVAARRALAVPSGSEAYRVRLERTAREVGERWQAQVLVDPAVRLSRPPRPLPSASSLEGALDALVASQNGGAWRRVRIPGAIANVPPAEQLAAEVRAVERTGFSTLGIENVALGHWSRLEKNRPTGHGAADPPASPAEETVYLLFNPTAPAEEGSLGTQIASLQRQQLEAPVGVEAQPLAYARMMQLLQALPPADREVFARRTVEAGMQTWISTPGEQRRQMMEQTFGLLQQLGVTGPDGGPPPARPRPPVSSRPTSLHTGTRSYLTELKSLGRELTGRYGVPIAIDPEVFVVQRPRRPAPELPAEKAMAVVAGSLPGVAWRKVYVSDADYQRLESPRVADVLAADVRRLELHEGGSLEVEQVRARKAVRYRRGLPVTPRFEGERLATGLGKEPVYVLFSTTPSARGATAEARFDDLQRQQIGLMLRMSPAQMGQAMQQLIDGYGSLDPAAQKRMLGLPLMAGMMAGWFPRQAKEDR